MKLAISVPNIQPPNNFDMCFYRGNSHAIGTNGPSASWAGF